MIREMMSVGGKTTRPARPAVATATGSCACRRADAPARPAAKPAHWPPPPWHRPVRQTRRCRRRSPAGPGARSRWRRPPRLAAARCPAVVGEEEDRRALSQDGRRVQAAAISQGRPELGWRLVAQGTSRATWATTAAISSRPRAPAARPGKKNATSASPSLATSRSTREREGRQRHRRSCHRETSPALSLGKLVHLLQQDTQSCCRTEMGDCRSGSAVDAAPLFQMLRRGLAALLACSPRSPSGGGQRGAGGGDPDAALGAVFRTSSAAGCPRPRKVDALIALPQLPAGPP